MSNNRYRNSLNRYRSYRGGYNSDRGGQNEYGRYVGPPIRKSIGKSHFYNKPERSFNNRFRSRPQIKRFDLPIRDSTPTKRIEIIRKGGKSEVIINEGNESNDKEEIKEPVKKELVRKEEEVKPTQLRVENLNPEVTNTELKVIQYLVHRSSFLLSVH